jgi:hypothetical protein
VAEVAAVVEETQPAMMRQAIEGKPPKERLLVKTDKDAPLMVAAAVPEAAD